MTLCSNETRYKSSGSPFCWGLRICGCQHESDNAGCWCLDVCLSSHLGLLLSNLVWAIALSLSCSHTPSVPLTSVLPLLHAYILSYYRKAWKYLQCLCIIYLLNGVPHSSSQNCIKAKEQDLHVSSPLARKGKQSFLLTGIQMLTAV